MIIVICNFFVHLRHYIYLYTYMFTLCVWFWFSISLLSHINSLLLDVLPFHLWIGHRHFFIIWSTYSKEIKKTFNRRNKISRIVLTIISIKINTTMSVCERVCVYIVQQQSTHHIYSMEEQRRIFIYIFNAPFLLLFYLTRSQSFNIRSLIH